jgi:hypothetical protein
VAQGELFNSDHFVAGLLIQGWLVRGFRIRTRSQSPLTEKMPSKLAPLWWSSFAQLRAIRALRSLLIPGCTLINLNLLGAMVSGVDKGTVPNAVIATGKAFRRIQ